MSSTSWLDPEAGGGAAASSTNWAAGDAGDAKPTTDASDWQADENASSNIASEKPEKSGGRCLMWLKLAISLAFLVIFAISASYELNDTSLVAMWFIFYLLHAILALLGLIRPFLCTQLLTKPILLMAAAMLIWSVVLMGIAAANLAKAESGGAEIGGDVNGATNRQEIGYELGGSILGVLSSIYLLVMGQFCDKNDD